MTTTNIILIAVAAVAIFGALGAFAVAFRRSHTEADSPPERDWRSRVAPETRHADESMKGVRVEPIPAAPVVEEVEEEPADEPEVVDEVPQEAELEPATVSVVEAQRVVEVSREEAGVTRRQFFNRAMSGFFGLWAAGLGLGFLAFFWPRVTGGFGASIVAGTVADIQGSVHNSDGGVVPLFVPEARAYVVPAPSSISEQFVGRNVEVGGLMALYQRCVHLGCRVPWCSTSQGFECPCHGSKYNEIGEYFSGPAPRNLDRFVIEVNEANELIIHTGDIIETPRAPTASVEYPRGPSCIGV